MLLWLRLKLENVKQLCKNPAAFEDLFSFTTALFSDKQCKVNADWWFNERHLCPVEGSWIQYNNKLQRGICVTRHIRDKTTGAEVTAKLVIYEQQTTGNGTVMLVS